MVHSIVNLSYLIFLPILLFFLTMPQVGAENSNQSMKMDEIVITPGKFSIVDRIRSNLTLSKKEIDNFPLIDNDIMRSAQIFPGVISNDFSARFNVRGGEKDEILVRLDGMELYEPFHLQDYGGALSVIDLGLLDRADLLMGGFPAKYGGKMSGVFDIISKDGNRDKITGNLGIDLINAHALLEGPLSKQGSWILSIRRGYFDLLLPMIFSLLEEYEKEYKPEYADLYSKVSYDLTDKDKLSLNVLYSLDRNLVNSHSGEEDLNSRYRNGMSWLKWRHFLNQQVWSDLFFFNGLSDRNRQEGFGTQRGKALDIRDLNYFGFKWEVFTKVSNKHFFQLGLDWRQLGGRYDYFNQLGINQTKPIEVKIEKTGNDLNAYLQDEWRVHPRTSINLGVRFLRQSYRSDEAKKYELSPRFALAFKPTKDIVLRGAWGHYHQPINLITMPVEDQHTEIGNAEFASHFVFGAEYLGLENSYFLLEAYYKKLDNLTGRMHVYGRQPVILANPDSGKASGLELLIRHQISDRLNCNLGYGLSVAKEKIGDKEFFRSFDQRHSMGLNFNYHLSLKSNLNVGWRFHSGQPSIPLESGTVVCERSIDEYNSERLPVYHSLDIRFTRSVHHKKWDMNWYFQIINLYSRKNIDARVLKIVKNEETSAIIGCEVVDEPLLPIVPTLGFNIRF